MLFVLILVGPPDAPPCQLSLKTWQTDKDNCYWNDCSLTVGFKYPVIPTRVKLWVTSHVVDGIESLQLEFTDGSMVNKNDVKISCETPYTTILSTNKVLSKVWFIIPIPKLIS